jgi:hypothetical protein
MLRHSSKLRKLGPLALAAGVLLQSSGQAGELMTLNYEYAASPSGPWSPVHPDSVRVSPTGAITVETDAGANVYFRLRVAANGRDTSIPVVTLAQIPSATLTAARNQLTRLIASPDTEFGDQLADVTLAPFAAPLMDSSDGSGPSHFEFKFVRKPRMSRETGFRKFDSEETGETTRGYMICSANPNDMPIVEFATEGGTPVESLLRKCGDLTPARIIRYGAGFWVAENERGELIANHGTEPFRPPEGLFALASQVVTGNGDTETGQHEPPPTTEKLVPTYYRSYGEFKSDYETNRFYKLLRNRRAVHAKAFWDAERGIFPQILRVADGEVATFLPGVQVDAVIPEVELGERVIASVSPIVRVGGLRIQGIIPGRMGIKVRVNESVTRYLVEVTAPRIGAVAPEEPLFAPASSSGPYWKTITEAYAGGWADQMRWWQFKDSDWCDSVGCGPTALGMLLGWWENKKSVESAFYTAANSFSSLSTVDAPQFPDTSSKKAKVKAAYRLLHEYCDVICDPFSDAGATMPSDLIEGFFSYIHPVASKIGLSSILYGKGENLVGYSYSYAYDFWGDDWDSSGSRVANGIKSGRPGVIGLGWLWHYAVAYGYLRQDYVVNLNGNDQYLGLRKRFLKCNEGWGKDSPAWYSAYDVFLGLSVNMWQKTVPTQP